MIHKNDKSWKILNTSRTNYFLKNTFTNKWFFFTKYKNTHITLLIGTYWPRTQNTLKHYLLCIRTAERLVITHWGSDFSFSLIVVLIQPSIKSKSDNVLQLENKFFISKTLYGTIYTKALQIIFFVFFSD